MSNGIVVRASSLGKMYRVFSSRVDNLVDALGLAWAVPGVKQRYREFWALRGVDLELRAGSRIGIVGRNGAGKSTLLKLITGNLAPTEGAVEVHEVIHALIEAGAGFHPEFTGFENIRAALTYQGLTPSETEAAIAEIAEFTELGEFLDQPYRTYSSGMQARLAFATATAILSPKILIIDEILGAGDAYFVSKCNERMRALVSSGATVILVSHSLDHVTSICEEAIWIDRGRIVKRGAALEVVKAYQQFLRVLDDRRLKAKNRKVHSAHYHPLQYDNFSDTLVVQAMVKGPANATCEVAELCLLRGGEVEDRLLVGHAQDADPTQASFILADSSHWGPPMWVGRVLCRQITVPPTGNPGLGVAAFNLYSIYEDTDYALEVTYRSEVPVEFAAEVYRNGVLHGRFELPVRTGHWARGRLEIPRFVHGSPGPARTAEQLPAELTTVQEAAPAGPAKRRKSRWPGEGRLAIEEVLLLDEEGRERAVFPAGSTMRLNVRFKARETGTFDVIPVAVLYRLDGVLVCRYVGAKVCLPMDAEESREATLTVAPLKLGNGYFVFTVALYRVLDLRNLEEAKFYDLLDRSYEFGVEGTPPMLDGIFNEPGQWAFDGRRPLALFVVGRHREGVRDLVKSQTDVHWNQRARGVEKDAEVNIMDVFQRELEYECIGRYLRPDMRLLEVGCGNGFSTNRFRPSVRHVDAFDYSLEMIERARATFGETNNRFIHDNVLDPKQLRGCYDAVLCVRVLINLRNLEEQQRALAKLGALVKPQGLMILAEGFKNGFAALSVLRAAVGMPAVEPAAINFYSSIEDIVPELERDFQIEDRFHLGAYDYLTRVLYPLVVGPENARHNTVFSERCQVLARAFNPDAFRELSRMQGFVLRKRA